jgi:hypothetical protein
MVSKLFAEMAFGGNGNRIFFVFGEKGLRQKRPILFWRKRVTPNLRMGIFYSSDDKNNSCNGYIILNSRKIFLKNSIE